MRKYICDVCEYIYDPEKGDPDDWICPVCGADKSQFKVVE